MTPMRGRGGHRGATAVAILVGFLAMAAVMGFGLATTTDPGAGGRGAPAPGSSRTTSSGSSTSSPTSTPLGRSAPRRLRIPAIGVDGKVARLGLAKNGRTLQLPKKPKRAGWYDRSATPGEFGPMIVVGYIDAGVRGPGVFKRMRKLRADDTIAMTRADGVVATYRVDVVKSYPPAELPVHEVYGAAHVPVLRIITCGGSLTQGARPTNVVVYASLVGITR